MNTLNKVINKIKLRIYNKDSWAYRLTMLKLLYVDHFHVNKAVLTLTQLDLEIQKGTFVFLLNGYEDALYLEQSLQAVFTIEDNRLYIKIDTLKLEVQTAEELFILKEIFIEGVYNFNLVDDVKNYILIDIGMNVSYASCYFAKVKQVPQVISFEPFTPTYTQATVNIALNKLEHQIDARNYGLGGCNEELCVPYTSEFRGQVGIQGTNNIRSTITESVMEKISIKDAFEPLDHIVKEYPSKKFIMKIDCEGAEYDLIDKIPEEMLKNCELIMMEWHEKGPSKIEEWLSNHGFIQMSFYPHSKRAGMLYAVKSYV